MPEKIIIKIDLSRTRHVLEKNSARKIKQINK